MKKLVIENKQVVAASAAVPLLVTTEHKGVFFGYGQPTEGTTVRLERAQMAVYWSTAEKGVLGLASAGPGSGCRIGPPVPAITLQKVTAVVECSAEAAAAWAKQPWS